MIVRNVFDTMPDGRTVYIYKISNVNGVYAEVITRGATLQSFVCPNKNGDMGDIICGFDDIEGHIKTTTYTGQTIGQYANRIAGGSFKIGENEYFVTKNENGKTCLHGGAEYSSALWQPMIVEENALELSYHSPDGEQGFPGNVDVSVTYMLTNKNELEIHYKATTDADTIINLTNHAYFNLDADVTKSILDTELMINASSFTPVDENLIPIGEIKTVENSAFDFREFKAIGRDIENNDEQLKLCGGYDHNFCIDGDVRDVKLVAKARSNDSGRTLACFCDLPGVQLYTGNFMGGETGKGGRKFQKHSGFCLETQFYPDTPNKENFPSCCLKAGESFESVTIFKVGVEE